MRSPKRIFLASDCAWVESALQQFSIDFGGCGVVWCYACGGGGGGDGGGDDGGGMRVRVRVCVCVCARACLKGMESSNKSLIVLLNVPSHACNCFLLVQIPCHVSCAQRGDLSRGARGEVCVALARVQ